MKILFVIFILIWGFVGACGVWNCKENRINYEMLIFLFIVPFIPLIAHFFKII